MEKLGSAREGMCGWRGFRIVTHTQKKRTARTSFPGLRERGSFCISWYSLNKPRELSTAPSRKVLRAGLRFLPAWSTPAVKSSPFSMPEVTFGPLAAAPPAAGLLAASKSSESPPLAVASFCLLCFRALKGIIFTLYTENVCAYKMLKPTQKRGVCFVLVLLGRVARTPPVSTSSSPSCHVMKST